MSKHTHQNHQLRSVFNTMANQGLKLTKNVIQFSLFYGKYIVTHPEKN